MQTGILEPVPSHARYLGFSLRPGADPRPGLRALATAADGCATVVGLGATLVAELSARVPGLRPFPPLVGAGVELPATPAAVWCWLRGEAPGELYLRGAELTRLLADAFLPQEAVDAFRHLGGRDLTGYEDGTENPVGDEALQAGFIEGGPAGLAGSSFVAVQRWQHDFAAIGAMSPAARDLAIGRRLADNTEIDDAPPSAHVRRTAQEDFSPAAFTLRRSMPWVQGERGGLMFVSFGAAFDGFEAQLRRMIGADDGTRDAIFGMSRPLSGAYFWCPPVAAGRLDLRLIGL
jgi:putative iron-dependent peroxidase